MGGTFDLQRRLAGLLRRTARWPRQAGRACRATLSGVLTVCATAAIAQPSAPAESHALLMWVSDYGHREANLPGVAHDADRAQQIAALIGVPRRNVRTLSEAAVTQLGIEAALRQLLQRIRPGDRVFIYFSGHGKQVDGARFGAVCSEGLVTQDGALYLDIAIQYSVQQLAEKAGQVVMMNDSCHAGGAATKRFIPDVGADDEVPKSYPFEVSKVVGQTATAKDGQRCGQPVNKSFDPAAAMARGALPQRWLYLAAARADEVAFASGTGSRATRAWLRCLAEPGLRADADGDGQVSGEELLACAQPLVDRMGRERQHLAVEGNARMAILRLSARR